MIRQLIPLVLSVNTLALMWLVGNKRVLGWVLGLGGQVVWFAFIVVFEAWGLLPLAIGLTVVYARNLVRWRRSWIQRDLRRLRKQRIGDYTETEVGR